MISEVHDLNRVAVFSVTRTVHTVSVLLVSGTLLYCFIIHSGITVKIMTVMMILIIITEIWHIMRDASGYINGMPHRCIVIN